MEFVDDPFNNLSEFITFDVGLCSTPSSLDHFLPYYSYSPALPVSYGSLASTPINTETSATSANALSSLNEEEDEIIYRQNEDEVNLNVCSDTNNRSRSGDLASTSNASNTLIGATPRSPRCSLAERMLRALSLFKASAGAGTGMLLQVWMPVKSGTQYILSTSDQPYLFDRMLAEYREISRRFSFPVVDAQGSVLGAGLPGRVFTSGRPEWTSNVVHYSQGEYLRVHHAIGNKVRGSLAMPIFNPSDKTCCGVLEVVTLKEKSNFYLEMENLYRVLKDVNLMTTTNRAVQPKHISMNKKNALVEIFDVLRAVCHSHMLPLALTWIPSEYSSIVIDDYSRVCLGETNNNFNGKNILCIHEEACYVSDKNMQDFVQACTEHYLKKGQGIGGRALQSNHPFFSPDVKNYDIKDYPLVHHARKFGLNAAVAIRIRSTYTGTDDYILEFFLPINCVGSSEQQLLLTNLSSTMQKICISLRTVSDAELVGSEDRGGIHGGPGCVEPVLMRGESSRPAMQTIPSYGEVRENSSHGKQKSPHQRRRTVERNIDKNTLQKYFSGSLKAASQSLGVCPTTLKRICRQHGIKRWPSRKIKKVNQSLKKIQKVIESVHGVQAGRNFDSITGNFLTSSSTTSHIESENQFGGYNFTSLASSSMEAANEMDPRRGQDFETAEHRHPTSPSMPNSSNSSHTMGSASSTPKSVIEENIKKQFTVKARYKDDQLVRFRFEPCDGCDHLYKEVAKRLKLTVGAFQMKYQDDDKEYVTLGGDSDLQQCLEILESVPTSYIILSVEDTLVGGSALDRNE